MNIKYFRKHIKWTPLTCVIIPAYIVVLRFGQNNAKNSKGNIPPCQVVVQSFSLFFWNVTGRYADKTSFGKVARCCPISHIIGTWSYMHKFWFIVTIFRNAVLPVVHVDCVCVCKKKKQLIKQLHVSWMFVCTCKNRSILPCTWMYLLNSVGLSS